MSLEYVIYTDESEKGKFYGTSTEVCSCYLPDLQPMISRLEQCKARLNLHQEVKWQRSRRITWRSTRP